MKKIINYYRRVSPNTKWLCEMWADVLLIGTPMYMFIISLPKWLVRYNIDKSFIKK